MHILSSPFTRPSAGLIGLLAALIAVPAASAATIPVSPGANALQNAITAANPGDTLTLAAGTYNEQVDIAKNLTITGAGAGSTTISAPGSMTVKTAAKKPIVYAHGATVNISGVTVDGLRSGGTNSELVGIMFDAASGSITNSTVTGTRDATISGSQRGYGIWVSAPSAQAVTIDHDTVADYQKGGMLLEGAGLTATVSNNVVTGAGEIQNAANGIVLRNGAVGSITGNTVSDNRCGLAVQCGPDYFNQSQGFGIMLIDSGPATASGNTSSNNDGGLVVEDVTGTATIANNTLTGNRYEGFFTDGSPLSASANVLTGGIHGLVVVSYEGFTAPTGSFTGNRIADTTGSSVIIEQDSPLAPAPTLALHGNRFAATGVAVASTTATSQDATGNWWGCNAGPGSAGCSTTSGLVNAGSPLQLTLTRSPATVLPNGTSTLTASFGSSAFPAVSVAFAKTAGGGSVSPASAVTSSGSAQSVFTAPASDGSSTVSATFENQTVSTTVTTATPVVTPPVVTPPVEKPPVAADNAPTGDNAPPATPPAVQPPQEGQLTTVAGTLGGGTQTVEVTNSSNDPGTTELAVNLAGEGTLVIKSGDQTITVTVAKDGTTTITPEGGEPIVVSGADGKTAGTVGIKVTPDGVTYTLSDPGAKTVKIGEATLTVPGTATIEKSAGKTTYDIKGAGICVADLDPAVSNDFTSGQNVQCTIDQGATGAGLRSVRAAAAAKSRRDSIRTGRRNDRISAGPGADTVSAGGGNDVVYGDRSLASQALSANLRRAYTAAIKRVSGPDRLRGEAGNDRLYGDGGNDTIWGASGSDRLFGNLGNDHISGGAGDDVIDGGAGRDIISGGAGDDVIRSHSNGKDRISCGAGEDTVHAGPFDVVFSDCEHVLRH